MILPRPWFASGLRFACLPGCHRCCGRPGIVQLRDDEPGRLAAALSMPLAEFNRRFVLCDRANGAHMDEGPGGGCPLWHGGCGAYAARPRQCRGYPFWPELIRSERAWRREAAFCPGINRGRLFSAGEIVALALAGA